MNQMNASTWRKAAAIAALSTAFVASGVSPRADAQELKKLRVSMSTQVMIYAPYLIPIEKGYYAEEGLELDVTIASGGVSVPAVISGNLDITTSNPSAIAPILRGAALKIVYTMANRSQYQLWSTVPEIKTLQDLKGKQVGIAARGDSLEVAMKLALLKNGLPLDWVGYTPLGSISNLTAALGAGSVPALILTDVDFEAARRAGVLKGNLIYDMFKNLPVPYSGIAVTDEFVQTRTDALRGFLRATMKGVRYMQRYKAQTIAIVQKYSKKTDPALDELDYDSAVSTLTKDGSVPDDVLRTDLEVRAAILNIPSDRIPPLDRVYDFRIVREVNAELDRSGWAPKP